MHIAKKRPLSRYLKDFKHTQIRCAHCGKALDRITLVRDGEIINKLAISRLDTLMDDAQWAAERPRWTALCRFCGDLHCKTRSGFFDIIGFKRYLFEQTDMSPGTVASTWCACAGSGSTSVLTTSIRPCWRTIRTNRSPAGCRPPAPITTASRCENTRSLCAPLPHPISR